MPTHSRRALLRAAGAGLAGGLATGLSGCVESIDSLGTAEPTPPDVQTPSGGECDDANRPSPTVDPPQAQPVEYPDYPEEVTEDSLEAFLEEFEAAYKRNEIIADSSANDQCVEHLGAHVNSVDVEPLGPGFEATVEWFASYKGTHCSTPTDDGPTPTSLPHADIPGETEFYATEEFLMREGVAVVCR